MPLRNPLARLARYGRILRQYVVIGAVRKSQFRVEFWSQVVMDVLWYTIHVTVFEVLFTHTDHIAGWTRPEVRVFLGFMFVADAFMMAFLGAVWHFPRDLKDGKLDPFRVRPASCVFLYFFQSYSLEGTVNGAIATAYLLVTTHWAMSLARPEVWLLLVWGFGLACWTRFITLVAYSIAEFYFLNSEISGVLDDMFDSATARPLDVFGRRLRFALISVVPVGLLTYVPAALVLGKMSVATGVAITAWMALFSCLVVRAWYRGFRRYESAMG